MIKTITLERVYRYCRSGQTLVYVAVVETDMETTYQFAFLDDPSIKGNSSYLSCCRGYGLFLHEPIFLRGKPQIQQTPVFLWQPDSDKPFLGAPGNPNWIRLYPVPMAQVRFFDENKARQVLESFKQRRQQKPVGKILQSCPDLLCHLEQLRQHEQEEDRPSK